jgi:hypothetical protein
MSAAVSAHLNTRLTVTTIMSSDTATATTPIGYMATALFALGKLSQKQIPIPPSQPSGSGVFGSGEKDATPNGCGIFLFFWGYQFIFR